MQKAKRTLRHPIEGPLFSREPFILHPNHHVRISLHAHFQL